MDRGRDRRYDDRDASYGGETYRPSDRQARSPPRSDTYRAPLRHGRSPLHGDTYAPRGGRGDDRARSRSPRRRSRSPARRGRDNVGSYRGRPRTPPNGRTRSPLPQRRRSRTPPMNVRARSPLPQKRPRETSPPASYRQRSPPPAKQSRYAEPERDDYDRRDDRRGHSPAREAAPRYRENNYRPRERSRTPLRFSAHASRGDSPISSRRSSPPMHPDRTIVDRRSPAYVNNRRDHNSDRRSPPPRVRDSTPPRRARSPPIPKSPPHEVASYRDRSPPTRERERDQPQSTATPNKWSNAQMEGPSSSYRNGDSRPPANGSASRYDNHPREPREPTHSGPPSAPISMSAHNRTPTNALLSAPTRPRGGPSFGRDHPREAPYSAPPAHRGGNHRYNAPPPRNYPPHSPTAIPTGPRSGYNAPNDAPGPRYEAPRVPFRPNNSSSTTYPRTQRFNTHMSSVPSIVDGGKKLPSGLDPAQEKRLQQLEDDKRKLMDVIEEKQRAKRAGLREWEKSERESAREGLRSELAEGHLAKLSGEGGVGGGAY